MSKNFDTDLRKFFRYMAKMQKEMGYTLEQTVMEGARLFARSAAKWTPWPIGKKIPKKIFSRKIRKVFVSLKSGKEAPKKVIVKGKPPKGFRSEWVVFRKVPRTRKTERIRFTSESAAKQAAKIHTRGLLRAGWWGSCINLGWNPSKIGEQYGDAVLSLVKQVAKTTKEKTDSTATVTMINAVDEANSEAGKRMGLTIGTGKAANIMKQWMARKANELNNIPF